MQAVRAREIDDADQVGGWIILDDEGNKVDRFHPPASIAGADDVSAADVLAAYEVAAQEVSDPARLEAEMQAANDRRMLLEAAIAKAAADVTADDTAPAELKAAAERQTARLADAVKDRTTSRT